MAANVPSQGSLSEHVQTPLERVDSEYECDLMIEALSRELTVIRDHLAFLTHHLHTETQGEPPSHHMSTPSPAQTQRTVSPEQKHVRRKVEAVQPVVVSPEEETRRRTHYLGVVDRLEGERTVARKQCLLLMKTHIEEQLVTLQRRSEVLRKKLARRQGRIRAAKLKLKPPRYRSSGVDDISFLGNVYISTFYQIVDEEHRLRQTGKLKTLTDLKQFWDNMLNPLALGDPTPQPHPPEAEEEEDEDYTNSWALTALAPDSQRKTPVRSTPDKDPLEYVPSVPPTLRSIADILDKGRQLKEEVSTHHYSLSDVLTEKRQVQRMYQQAKANEMAMRRLLPPSPAFDLSPFPAPPSSRQSTGCTEHSLAESDLPPVEHTHTPAVACTVSRLVTQQPATMAPPTHLTPSPPTAYPSTLITNVTPSPQKPLQRLRKAPSPVLAPLTMDSALQEGRVIEPKCKSTLWTNFITVQR